MENNGEGELVGIVIGMDEIQMIAEILIDGEEIVFQPVSRLYAFGEEIIVYEEEIRKPYWDRDY